MKTIQKLVCALALLIAPTAAFAAKGVVVYYKSGCDYFIAETNMGYVLLEWYGGYDPNQGDMIAGEIDSYGMKDIYNLTADQETHVWIEDYMLSKDNALEKYFDKCN